MEKLRPDPRPLVLPEELQVIAYHEGIDLTQNASNYPLLTREFDDDQLAEIELTKQALLALPVTHSSKRELKGDIVPLGQQVPSEEGPIGNTWDIDESLGLNECVFMQWGAVEKSGGYGRHHTLIDPEFVFNSPRCFVTPRDIMDSTLFDDSKYDQLSPEAQKKVVDDYLSKILSGKDWLELVARQVYLATRTGKPVTIEDAKKFGEIKFFGTIPEATIQEVIGPEDERRIWKKLFLSGFIVGPVHRSGNRTVAYDATPQELGLSGHEAADFWTSLYQD